MVELRLLNQRNGYRCASNFDIRKNLYFDYLFCLTCVDWKTHLTMVYHLTSTKHRHTMVVKSKLDRNNPEIETVSDISGEQQNFMKGKCMNCLV